MANKTIHELTPASTISSDYEFAVYDIDGSTTKKATAEQVLGTSSLLYADDSEEPTGEVSFVSQDTMLTPASTDTLSVELLQGTDTWGARFQKISQMFRNIRYLLRTMGTTDISSIGNGTVTGIVSSHNNSINALNSSSSVMGVITAETTWATTASSSVGVALTGSMTLPQGRYFIIGQIPISNNDAGACSLDGNSSLSHRGGVYFSTKSYETIFDYVVAIHDGATCKLVSSGSQSITFSSTARGYLRAVRIGDY